MDLKTSFAFYFVSLGLYIVVLTAMALADKRVVGTRWLAYSVFTEMVKTALQVGETGGRSTLPRAFVTLVPTELNVITFFTMYMGMRWFLQRAPLRSRSGPMMVLIVMAAYCGMYMLHIPYGVELTAAAILWMCGAMTLMMWRQKEERFRLPARITIGLMMGTMGLSIYRATLAAELYRQSDWRLPGNDPRWNYSMLFIVLMANCMLIVYVWFAAAEMYSAVEATAGLDALTGCLNRRALMKLASHEVARSERSGMPLTVVVLDLDYFKGVNDTYGHAGGDATLCAMAGLVTNRLRSVDVVARIGGEEFLLLLPDTDAVSGAKVVEGLRQAIEAMRVEHEGRTITTTLSAGVTQGLGRGDSWTAMMNRADRAMYQAKNAGRNCVVVDDQALQLPRRTTVREEEPRHYGGATDTPHRPSLQLIRRRMG